MAYGQIVQCPKGHGPMMEQNLNGVAIDVCPAGCCHLDPGELEMLMGVMSQNGARLAPRVMQQVHAVQDHRRHHGHGVPSHHGRHYGGSSGGLFGGSNDFFESS